MSLKKVLLGLLVLIMGVTVFACTSKKEVNNNASNETVIETTKEVVETKATKVSVNIKDVDISDVEDGKMYQEIKYQVLTCDNQKLQESLNVLNEDMKSYAEKFKKENATAIRDFIKEMDMPDAMYASTHSIEVMRNDGKYLSLTDFVYENLMGAHGNYVSNGYTYDVKTGKKLNLMDFVKDKEELRKFLKDWVKQKNSEDNVFFDEADATIDAYLNGEYELQFYLDKEDLIIVFQTYDIAPYAVGLIEIKVDKNLLKED